MDVFWGAIPSALAAATPHRRGSTAQGTWMVDEWYGVHVGKKIESIGDVAISGFFQHHTLILLIGADFVARSVLRVCECHETTFQSSVFGRE